MAVRPHVVEHLTDGPVLADRHVLRRHQAPDGVLRIAQQGDGDGALSWRQQGEQLPGRFGRQLLEEVGALVRRHVAEQRGDVLLGHSLQERFLVVLRQVLEHGRGVLARQHPEDHDLIFQAERREQRGDIARVTVPQHVAQSRVVAGSNDRRQFFGGPRDLTDGLDRRIALRSGKLLFHLSEGGSDDVVVMDVGPDGLDGVEPETMNRDRDRLRRGRADARRGDTRRRARCDDGP